MIILALVGVGNWGNKILFETKFVPGLKIKYLCSPHIFSKKIQGNFSYVTDYKKLLSVEKLDGVIIATPVEAHFEIASYFIKHQIPVFIEKPYFNSLAETQKFIALRDKHNVPCMFSRIYSFDPELKKIAKLNTKLGSILSAEIQLGNKEPNTKNLPIISEWLPHVLNILFVLCSKLPVSLSVDHESKSNKNRLNVHLKYDDFNATARIGWGFSTRKRELDIKYIKGDLLIKDLTKMNTKNPKSSLFYELSHFMKVIESRKVSISDLEYLIDIMRLLFASQLSLEKEGREISL